MADRFLLLNYLTRQVVAELPAIGSMSYTETLNKPGSFSCTIPISSDVGADDLYSSRAIFAFERAELLRAVGPILSARIDPGAGTIALAGEGHMNLLKRRILWTTKTYSGIDQLLIVKDLIDYAQNTFGTPGNLGITTTALTAITTTNRTKVYYWYERKKIGELIEQLSETENGFDFRLTPRWTSGPNSTMALDFGVTYPKSGRQTGYVFDVNAVDITAIDVDMSRFAFQAVASGSGTGEAIPSVSVINSPRISTNALLEDAITIGDESSLINLRDYGNRRLALGQTPLLFPTIRLTSEYLGAFIPGDQVRFVGSAGVLDITGTYRIVEQTFSLEADGEESLTITLAPLAAWSL